MNIYTEFKELQLIPAMWEDLTIAFPEYQFRRAKGGQDKWVSQYHRDTAVKDSKSQFTTNAYKTLKGKYKIKDFGGNGGKAEELVDHFMKVHDLSFVDAILELSKRYGLEPPTRNREEWTAQDTERQSMKRAKETFKAALWSGSVEANEVINYLHSRQWTDKEIENIGFGLITPEIRASLPDGEKFKGLYQGDKGEWHDGVEERTHTLAIPFTQGSSIVGFKFREPRQDLETPTKYTNTQKLPKGDAFFNIKIKPDKVTIVEGEFDALRATARGITDVVATAGDAASPGQIQDAIKRGVERFTLLFDNDERGKGFIVSTIDLIKEIAPTASIYIASLPDGQGKDVDEYLTTYGHEKADLEYIINDAAPLPIYEVSEVLRAVESKLKDNGGKLSHEDRETAANFIESVLKDPSLNGERREYIKRQLRSEGVDDIFGIEGLIEDADKEYYRTQTKNRADEVQKVVGEINKAAEAGDIDKVVSLMEKTSSEVGIQDKAEEFDKAFAPMSPDDVDRLLESVTEGIPTGFVFEDRSRKKAEELTLNSGLTFICGYRGHGKTSFLNNIALNEATRNIKLGNGKSVLYFSYEVDKRRLLIDLINTYVNDPNISKNPFNTIAAYYRHAGDRFFEGNGTAKAKRFDNFVKKQAQFKRNYLNRALILVEENYKVEDLLQAIKRYVSRHEVSIVCIDYAQLIYSKDYSRQRTEEIKKVVNDIKNYSNKSGIPFVLAAQFNRDVDSPIGVDTKNIGEGGDFERIADTCIGLFNLKELHPLPTGKEEAKSAARLINELKNNTRPRVDDDGKIIEESQKKIESIPNFLSNEAPDLAPVEGWLFARLMKRRYGYYPIDTLFEWEGRTKYITPNAPEKLKVEAVQVNLFDDDAPDTSSDNVTTGNVDSSGNDLPF